jgi:hypothetical protein
MPELLLNLHMHTTYSDGTGSHAQIARAAIRSGLDAVIVTDHNVLVHGVEKYVQEKNRRLLMLVGEEIHDQARDPQKNHLLVYGANRELAQYAKNPQNLIDLVQQSNGLCFIAHPTDPELPLFGETDISWVDWNVHGFTGIELWNGFSELKNVIHSRLEAIFYAFFPQFVAHSPLPEILSRWDNLLTTRREKVVAVGGSDAHALHMSLGPIHREIFPYDFHFRAINTHLLIEQELTGNFYEDRMQVMDALRQGHAFIGYDLPESTRGFRFTAQGRDTSVSMGDEIRLQSGVTFQIRLPVKVECRLIRDGQLVKTWMNREICTYIANQPGAYRVECYIDYLGQKRGWIFSNPIYVKS